jgi:hypothetical protein
MLQGFEGDGFALRVFLLGPVEKDAGQASYRATAARCVAMA